MDGDGIITITIIGVIPITVVVGIILITVAVIMAGVGIPVTTMATITAITTATGMDFIMVTIMEMVADNAKHITTVHEVPQIVM